MINLHKQFRSFFKKYKCLHDVHYDGKGIDATVPAEFGPAPMTLRYCGNKYVVARVFIPIRIPEKKMDSVSELITRLNHNQIRPQLVIDHDRRLVYSSRNELIEELENGCDWIDLLFDSNLKQLDGVYESFIEVLYKEVSPEAAVEKFVDRYSTKISPKQEASPTDNRLQGLYGGDPRLN